MNSLENFFNKFNLDVTILYQTDFFYTLKLNPPTKLKQIESLQDDLCLYLGALSVYMKKERDNVVLFVKNSLNSKMNLADYKDEIYPITASDWSPFDKYTIILGKTLDDRHIFYNPKIDLHAVIGGCSGYGKSTLLKSIIEQYFWCDQIMMHMIDTKCIDFKEINSRGYTGRFKLYTSIFQILSFLKYQNKLLDYIFKSNQIPTEPSLIIIDEYADLMSCEYSNEIKHELMRIVQRSRAANTYCILATQRPSAKIIDGGIKANFPTRIALKTTSAIDSRLIMNIPGAERFNTKGEAMISSSKYNGEIFQSFYV